MKEQNKLRVSLYNATPGFVSAATAGMELYLKKLYQLEVQEIKGSGLSEENAGDLLLISAMGIGGAEFVSWLHGLPRKIPKRQGIFVPAIIFAQIDPATLSELLIWAKKENWYFDIVDPDHGESLAIRVANFLKLHEHLHEVQRMSEMVNVLTERVEDMEQQLKKHLVPEKKK